MAKKLPMSATEDDSAVPLMESTDAGPSEANDPMSEPAATEPSAPAAEPAAEEQQPVDEPTPAENAPVESNADNQPQIDDDDVVFVVVVLFFC